MNETENKKATIVDAKSTVIALLVAAMNKDVDKACDAAYKYANILSTTDNFRMRILSLLKNRPLEMKTLQFNDKTKNLLTILPAEEGMNDRIFLPEDIDKQIKLILLEINHADLLLSHKIPFRNKILLHGTTGNGKTTLAKYIASSANLPLVVINTDMLIKSNMGATSQGINSIFSGVTQPCVLFLDEIDSIAMNRQNMSGTSVGEESHRIVNSLLVNIDSLSGKVIFIAATNMIDKLDPALLRRFDFRYEVHGPTHEQKMAFCKKLFLYYNVPVDLINELELDSLASFSDIKKAVLTAARKYLISQPKQDYVDSTN
jgi:SpoVK/Ycf46/Vps4 family AAA+-type ATPase